MKSPINQQHFIDYQRDGVVLIRNLIDADWLQLLADGIEQNLKNPTARSIDYVNDPTSNAHFFFDACTYRQNDAYDRLMLDSPMAETAARLMDCRKGVCFEYSCTPQHPQGSAVNSGTS